jgi:protein-S-isoprenylcysteine O-methyltransferase Ste14
MGVSTILFAAAAHAWLVRVEEPRLSVRHGAAYDAYRRYVARWWPSRRAIPEPLA